MFEKTAHLKFIDGILHQRHDPHPNITDKEPKWVPVESETTKVDPAKADPKDAGKSA